MLFLLPVTPKLSKAVRAALLPSFLAASLLGLLGPDTADAGTYIAAQDADRLASSMKLGAQFAAGDDADPANDSLTPLLLYSDNNRNTFHCCPDDRATYLIEWGGGPLYLWGRFYYPGNPPNEANSFFVGIAGKERKIFGNNVDRYRTWHWDGDGSIPDGLQGPAAPLYMGTFAAGPLELLVEQREVLPVGSQPRLDVLFLASGPDEVPNDVDASAALTHTGEWPNEPRAAVACTTDADCGGCAVCNEAAGRCEAVTAAGNLYVVAAAHPGAELGGTMTRASAVGMALPDALTGDAIFAASTGNGFDAGSADRADYVVDLPAPGTWYLWGRLRYPSPPPNGANSFFIEVDGGGPAILGNNKDFLAGDWHYDGDGSVPDGEQGPPRPLLLGTDLEAGPITLSVIKRETMPAPPLLELLCLTQDPDHVPTDLEVAAALSATTCGQAECGNGTVEAGEECDPPDGESCGVDCRLACQPEPERCDGVDNDCDGLVDEDFPLGLPCSVGTGSCQGNGVTVCAADGGGTVCDASASNSEPEICNGVDDDCDGEVDDGFDVGAPCSAGAGACEQAGVRICTIDGSGTVCDANAGSGQPETCNGVDDDCDGEVDDGFDVGTACTAGAGACQQEGVRICTIDGSGTVCDANAGSGQAETCNGVDDDCDGAVDEGFDIGSSCSAGTGACARSGVTVCAPGGAGTTCTATAGPGEGESCNGVDDDCDGAVDENFLLGDPCTVGVGACTRTGVEICAADGSGTMCDATPGAPAEEICDNGIDEDCDGSDAACPAICDAPPRLMAADTTCPRGQACLVPVLLEDGGTPVPSLSGTLAPSDALEVTGLSLGSCSAGAGLLTDAGGGFAVSDLADTPFCNGDVLVVELLCDTVGLHELALTDVTLEGISGEELPSVCGAPATVTCVDENILEQCMEPPRLVVEDADCPLDEPCDVSVILEPAAAEVPSLAATFDVPAGLSLGGLELGTCTAGALLFDQASPVFSIIDFGNAPFCAGDVLHAEVTCEQEGIFGLGLVGVTLGDTAGQPVEGACGHTGTIRCGLPVCGNGVVEAGEECEPPDTATCDAACSLVCQPQSELCDGVDNDCDALVDEGFALGQSCTAGIGACLREGTTVCAAVGTATECSAQPGSPADESCNGVDDDCDGQTDEGFALGQSCTVGVGACERTGALVCAAGGAGTTCDVTPGGPGDELCNGVDDDCDGQTDEGFALGQSCTVGVGACERTGALVCAAGGAGTTCDVTPGAAGDELCNGVDDDCDGQTDEGFALGQSCSEGVGVCRQDGLNVCSTDGTGVVCDATPFPPSVELCNGLDDDCDGAADEDFALGPCAVGVGACSRSGSLVCTGDGSAAVCEAAPGPPADEICGNGIDEDCNGADLACPTGCEVPPRLVVADTLCQVGESCSVAISLEAGDEEIPSIAALFQSPQALVLADVDAGACAAAATLFDQSLPVFALTDFGNEPFCDGEVVLTDVVCTEPGTFELALDGVSFGNVLGTPVEGGCGSPGQIHCALCGNGVIETGEECDDGTANSDTTPDACRSDCTLPACGDGVVDGDEQCDPPNGGACSVSCLTVCVPQAEVCDGLDNDCDELVDEGFDLGDTCMVGVGACQREGTLECAADGSSSVCSVTPGQAGTETCDGTDDDCDGSVDEGFDLGQSCSVGTGACAATGMTVCTNDGAGVECDATASEPSAELCNDVDDDCDGQTDEGFDLGPCTVGTGACQRDGTAVCTTDGTATACDVEPGQPGSELCNGLDDDCDGQTDDGFDLGSACTVGVGACTRSGVRVCASDGSAAQCDAAAGAPAGEICGNGIDEDCNGSDLTCSGACQEPPRLVVQETGCSLGRPCTVAVHLEAGDAEIPSLAASLSVPEGMTLLDLGLGTCSQDATLFEQASPAFVVTDFSSTPFCDGTVVTADLTCTTTGQLELGLAGVAFGDTAGQAVPGACGAPAQITCGTCGDGIVQQGEECDAGSANSNLEADACRLDCRLPNCGDGVVDQGEECDPPDGLVCGGDCQIQCEPATEVCGNGIDEDCDGSDLICPPPSCEAAPRLMVADTACQVGQPCQVPILVESGTEEVVSLSGELELAAEVTFDDLALGSCAAGGTLFDQAAPVFAVTSFAGAAFCDGQVVVAEVTCDQVGTFDVGLADVSLGDTAGQEVDGACGAVGTITCTSDAVIAQCLAPPRVVVGDAACTVGQPCQLALALEAGGEDVPSLAGELVLPGGLALTGLELGACSAGAVLFDQASPTFAVTDFTGAPFCDGTVVTADILCEQEGIFEVELAGTSLGTSTGAAVEGACATTGIVECTAACEGPPRLRVDDATCQVGQPCQVSVALESGQNLVASAAGTLEVPAELALGALATGACSSGAQLFDQASPTFALTDFSDVPLCDGQVLQAEITCSEPGVFELGLDGVSLGKMSGQSIAAACGLGGQVVCTDDALITQCEAPPRLALQETTCTVGEPCSVVVSLEAGDNLVPSVAATLEVPGPVSVDGLSLGSCAAGASLFEQASPTFAVTDFDNVPLCDGPVVVADVTCEQAGIFELGLAGTSLGNLLGQSLEEACGVGALLTCKARCDEAPRLRVEDALCQVGESCPVPVSLESGASSVSSISGRVNLPEQLTLGDLRVGVCGPGAQLFDQASPSYVLADFGGGALCDGQVLLADVDCAAEGAFAVGLSDVALGTTSGQGVTGACGAAGSVTCGAACTGAPRLRVADTTCTVGQLCQLTVMLEAESDAITSLSATLRPPDHVSIDGMSLGSCSAGAVLFDQNSPTFAVTHFGNQPLCDGAVLNATVTCTRPGTYAVLLENPSLGNQQGEAVDDACTVQGVVTCQ